MERIIKRNFIQVKEFTEEDNTFYEIDTYDGDTKVLTEFEVWQLRDILNKLLDN